MPAGFIIFAFDDFYPVGGERDIFGVYETLDDAMEAIPRKPTTKVEREGWVFDSSITSERMEMLQKDRYEIYDVKNQDTIARYKRVTDEAGVSALAPVMPSDRT